LAKNACISFASLISIVALTPVMKPGNALAGPTAQGNESPHNGRVLQTSFREKDWTASLGIEGEAAAIFNGHRKAGGNETSVGDIYINLIGDLEHKMDNCRLGIELDLVPSGSVLNFGDPAKTNKHNLNRMRADGYLNRPDVLTHIFYNWSSEKHYVGIGLGAMKFAGLGPIEGNPTKYYAAGLSPLELSQHYDKGILFEYACKSNTLGPVFNVNVGIIDGDWRMGEPSVFSYHDSRANGYPGYTSTWNIYLSALLSRPVQEKFGTVKLSGSWMKNDIGSNGGQKIRLSHTMYSLSYTTPSFSDMRFEIRGFLGDFEQGETWGPPLESTRVWGLEAALRFIRLGDIGSLDLYMGYSEMNLDSGHPAGIIWVSNNTTCEEQWQFGAVLAEPFGAPHLCPFVSVTLRDMDGLDDWVTLDKSHQFIYVVGVKYLF
jgi:hypothetical protein